MTGRSGIQAPFGAVDIGDHLAKLTDIHRVTSAIGSPGLRVAAEGASIANSVNIENIEYLRGAPTSKHGEPGRTMNTRQTKNMVTHTLDITVAVQLQVKISAYQSHSGLPLTRCRAVPTSDGQRMNFFGT